MPAKMNKQLIDVKTKLLVSGFLHQIQMIMLPIDVITFYNIPDLVSFECIKFYFICEQFERAGKLILLLMKDID